MPARLKARVEAALFEFDRQRVEMLVNGLPEVIATYETLAAEAAVEPRKSEKISAATALSKQAQDLASKMEFCGGADLAIAHVQRASDEDQPDIEKLRRDLHRFSEACAEAARLLNKAPNKTPGPTSARERMAAKLAELYMANLEERPATTVETETAVSHPFAAVLEILMEHCGCYSADMLTPAAVGRVAREGARALGAWRFGFDKKGRHRAPDL